MIFPQNRARGGNPEMFLTIRVFIQKFFIKCLYFSFIFSSIFNVVSKAVEYTNIKVKKHLFDTNALSRIQELLFIEEIAMIFFISIL